MSDSDEGLGIFEEPEGYYQAEKPATFFEQTFLDGRKLNLRLVGSSPLWGHHLWNAGRVISNYLQVNCTDVIRGKTVLELGAGAGLPALTAALHGASHVVVTDYPDNDLIDNLNINAESGRALDPSINISVEGLLWGASLDRVLAHISPAPTQGFDTVILADLLFNHSEHEKLADTVCAALKRTQESRALVFFTPYRPWLLERDLAFFDTIRNRGMEVEKVLETVMDKVMFENDPGDELLRRTVFGYNVQWESDALVTSK